MPVQTTTVGLEGLHFLLYYWVLNPVEKETRAYCSGLFLVSVPRREHARYLPSLFLEVRRTSE